MEQEPTSSQEISEEKRILIEKLLENQRDACERVLIRMKSDIDSRRWDSVLGDDVSGRIPALILWNVLRNAYAEQESAAPQAFFYAGGENIEQRRENLKEYVKRIKSKLGKRTLIVTEFVISGKSIKTLAEILREEGVDFDVATLYGYSDVEPETEEQRGLDLYSEERQEAKRKDLAKQLTLREENKLYDGYLSEYVPQKGGYELREYTGVEKNPDAHMPVSHKISADQELVNLTREKAAQLSQKLYQKLFKAE